MNMIYMRVGKIPHQKQYPNGEYMSTYYYMFDMNMYAHKNCIKRNCATFSSKWPEHVNLEKCQRIILHFFLYLVSDKTRWKENDRTHFYTINKMTHW